MQSSLRILLPVLTLLIIAFDPCHSLETSREKSEVAEGKPAHAAEREAATQAAQQLKETGALDDGSQRPREDVPITSPKKAAMQGLDLQVIQLTSRSFHQVSSDDNIWLIEFYTDWCSHCVSFASTYAEVAGHYHSQPQLKVKVAKVNVEQERALALRFGIKSFPSFFIVEKRSAYVFEQPRSKRQLMEFTSGGYKKQSPLPFYSSPMGPLGVAQGLLMSSGFLLTDVFFWLQNTFNMPSLVAGTVMFGTFFFGCFFCIVFCAIVFTPKAKAD